jgi:flagellar basal body-associated protein FliL
VRVYLKNYIFFLRTQGKASFKAGLIGGIHALKGSITGQIKSFAGLGGLRKFSLILVLVGAVGTGLYIRRIVTKGFIHEDTSLFLPSLEPIASEIIDIEPDAKMEPFYDNLRAIQNLILLPKMMVNLKRQGSPMANPMAAFELFIEGDSPEVAIEAKDKEVSVRDAIQRVVEEFTFDTLDTPEGKRAMSERIKKEVAKMFSTGGVRRIYIKTLVLKP